MADQVLAPELEVTRVLIVDDDQDDFVSLEGMLNAVGRYEITWASGADEGLEMMDDGSYDAVLVDHHLGSQTGLELITAAQMRGGAPPLILVTGVADNVVDRDAAHLGAADYLVKTGLAPESLDRSIRYAVSQRETFAALQQSESRFRAIFQNSPIGMALHSIGGDYLATNSVYDRMFGYTADMTLTDMIAAVAPESRDAVLAGFDHITSQRVESVSFEGAFKSGTGERVVAIVQLTRLSKPHPAPDQVFAQVVDVTELKATQARLEAQLQNKNQMMAAVSHELRTPLTAVIGLAELLRDGEMNLPAESRAEMIDAIVESGFDVSNMVEDLLTAARQEAGQLTVVAVPVNLEAQSRQVIEVISGSTSFTVAGSSPPATGDPGRVRQIIRNLLTNAVKYGGDDVRVDLDSVPEYARATVSDDGPGVPADFEEEIFGSYQRAHSIESHPSSVGIGLSISRELARAMGGDLVYRREGGRTRFELTLPEESPLSDESAT